MITIRLNTIKAVGVKSGSHGNERKLFILSNDLNSNLHTLDYRDVGAEREDRGGEGCVCRLLSVIMVYYVTIQCRKLVSDDMTEP